MIRSKLFLSLVVLLLAALTIVPAFAQDTVNITIRCKSSPPEEDWRCNVFSLVEEQVEQQLGVNINLNLIQDNIGWGDYKNEFVLASEAGAAPDIILSGHEDIGAWAPAGLIVPITDRIDDYPEFADMVPGLWDTVSFEGEVWGIPQDAEARPLFYSKLLLADLGWSDAEIESLPERIRSGEFTFRDMLDVAEEAVQAGVVEEGNGFWHRPTNGPDFLYWYFGMGGEIIDEEGQLVFDPPAAEKVYETMAEMVDRGIIRRDLIGSDFNTLYHPGVASADTVLFAAGGTWNWPNWALNFVADRGGDDYLQENVGFALIPAMETGEPITLTHPLVYLVSSGSPNQDVALALLAAISTPELNNLHAVDSFHLGILQSQVESEEYQSHPLLGGAHYMLDYATALPNHPGWSSWSTAFWTGIQAVQSGDLTPEAAVQTVINQLQNELGDGIVIR
jgi:inositol-phosphate transport system substrate-binding protein